MKATSRLLAIVIPIFLVMTSGCSSDASGDAPAGQNVEPASAQNGSPAATADQSVAEPENGADTGSLAGTSWRLVEIKSMDDSVYAPENPDHYTLTFGSDGSMSVTADCNRGTGSWKSESAGQLQFGVIAATQAMCPPNSLHDRFMGQFEWVRSYVLKDGHLFLATMADGSIIEFEPLSRAPVVATVLDEEVRASSADEMQEVILARLFGRYASKHDIAAEPSEIQAWIDALNRAKNQDRSEKEARLAELEERLETEDLSANVREPLQSEAAQLEGFLEALDVGSDLTAEESAQLEEMEQAMARSIIERWKLNRSLYREYGGRIIFQQLGPEPIDAYREFLEERQAEGAFAILEPEFESGFWRYFTNDSMHSFVEPGSEVEANAFEVPPWEQFSAGE
jgi:heat shock protein HslJ